MKILFDIGNLSEVNAENHSLLAEIGESYCMLGIYNGAKKELSAVRFVTFEPIQNEESIERILNELKEQEFNKAIFCSAFPHSILVPQKISSNDSSCKVFDRNQYQLEEAIPEWQIINFFSFPKPVYQKINAAFPDASFSHCFSPAIKIYNGFVAENQISIHFVPNQFRVIVKKEQQLQLAQVYHYTAPLDVIYFLLKICSEFSMQQSETAIILSGLVENNSALYKEIKSYFRHVHFATQPSVSVPDTHLPKHYFTSMYNLASCVS